MTTEGTGDARLPEYPGPAAERHLSTVSLSFNNIVYSVVGRIELDFGVESGDGNKRELDRVRLAPLKAADSGSLSTTIELHLKGRWRTGCAFLQKRDIVCVYCARVEPSNNPHIHDAQLVLDDDEAAIGSGLSKSRARDGCGAALFVLNTDGRATHVVAETHLGQGRMLVPSAVADEPVAGEMLESRKRARVQYRYHTINELWEEAAKLPASSGKRGVRGGVVNVYGVVVDARAASTTARVDLRSEIVLVDESSVMENGERRGMMVYRFDRNPRRALPFRALGDVVRCHRLALYRYDDYSGQMHVQGAAQNHSSFVLWAGDTDDERNMGNASNDALLDVDWRRVKQLRAFSRRFITCMRVSPRPFLRSISEIVGAGPQADFLRAPLDVVATLEQRPCVANEVVRFRLGDGRNCSAVVDVESVLSDVHLSKCRPHPFAHFAQSYSLGLQSAAMRWMLITDVRVKTVNSSRCVTLSVGKHTSTLLWLPTNCAQVDAHLNSAVGAALMQPQPRQSVGTPSASILREATAMRLEEEVASRSVVQNALATRWRTLGVHERMHMTVSTVLDVVGAAERNDRRILRLRARVCVWLRPTNLRCTSLPYCAACDEYQFSVKGSECAGCGSSNGWAYAARLLLGDDSGTTVCTWLEGDHATKFFAATNASLTPCDLRKNEAAAQHVRCVADSLLKPDTRLDCLVQPYCAVDSNGVRRVACRILHTAVLLDAV